MAGDAPGTAHENQARPGDPPARLALYRRYRPATFAEVKGQEHVTEPLRQALRNGRVHHAYLFSGPRGCGKTSSARILARSLNCAQGPTPDPCGVCESCVALAPSGPGSIDVIEIDAASHGGVDDARDLRERAFYAPVSGRFKVYIIDEAHMVTREGFNALLKLVEEPPPHLKFVFATTEPEKVIATIKSRTHHYPFRLVPPLVLRELLEGILQAEGVTYEPSVLPLVVRAGAGSVRDSLSVLDQLLAGADDDGLRYDRTVALLGYSDDSLLDEVVEAFVAGDGAAAFGAVDRMVQSGHDPRRFAADLLDRVRDLIILAAVPRAGESGLLDAPADRLERMTGQARRFGRAGLARAAEILSDGLIQMRGTASPRLLLELMCAQVMLPGAGTGEAALLARLERLEQRLEGAAGSGVPAPRSGSPAPPGRRPGMREETPDMRAAAPGGPAAAAPPRGKATGAPAGRPAGPGGSQSRGGHSGEGQAAPVRSGAGQPGAGRPGSGRAEEERRSEGGRPGAGQSGAGPGDDAGRAGVEALRRRWPDVLDAVRLERRLAWIQLRDATVQSLDGGVLLMGFGSEGVARGFSTSGCDQVLAGVLSAMLGLKVRVRATVGTAAAPAAPPGNSPVAASAPAEPGAPAETGPSPGIRPPTSGAATGSAETVEPPGGTGRPGPAPEDHSEVAGGRRPEGRRSGPVSSGAPRKSAGGRAPSGTARPPAAPGHPQAVSDSGSAAEEWPEHAAGHGPAGAGEGGPTGMELIQRQLGGRIIEEIEDA